MAWLGSVPKIFVVLLLLGPFLLFVIISHLSPRGGVQLFTEEGRYELSVALQQIWEWIIGQRTTEALRESESRVVKGMAGMLTGLFAGFSAIVVFAILTFLVICILLLISILRRIS